ncbi:[Pyruvate dehydrogenase [acetyl-transferring]]-phosphatase 1, mitochondrial [Podospora pseudocomata]|uniref:[Pyruvate dehydrogenase [acetyl-transferring]]-phosphatase 1, mitochondrial n=1 Tax=Podospora pseudocomata TaxID=2093779 RepID=A0ABR0G6K9_9PEZI|nr:[Pyruvate dehydrogenase [acetyl-transferring]]-phosphatase 1, mitochondrial [Podospora pseudocomata]
MRRAAVQAFRTTFQYTARGLGRRPFTTSLPTTAARRLLSSTSTAACRTLKNHSNATGIPPPLLENINNNNNSLPLPPPLQSSMYYRRASVVLASALVGYGAWYSYNGTDVNNVPVKRGYSTTTITDTSTADTSLPTRNVLVISADQLHTGTIVGDGPISKTTSEDGTRVIEMLNPEQATEKLRKLEESYLVNRGQGVVRYDLVQLPSNDPIEDDHTEKIIEMQPATSEKGGNDWMFWGVFDGHSGWTTSAKLRQTLVSFVARELNQTYQESNNDLSGPGVEAAIRKGFLKLDDEIVNQSVQKVMRANNKTMAAELLAPALSGSCALLSFYDSRSKLLRVACTGDSRAVLGRRTESGKWTATPLSVDQTGSNVDEASRLRREHPNEPYVVRNGRVLGGLEPSRAFGDASYKWTREISEKLRKHFFARSVSPALKTPPYVTAEPVITTTRIEPERGDFVVMATDGLWEMLTNEEVIGLVGKWIDAQQQKVGKQSGLFDSVWSRTFGGGGSSKDGPGGLPVEVSKVEEVEGQKTPFRGVRQWGGNDGFVVEDANVATHLVRNALGGKNREQVSALLTLPAPFSRRYRDDLTVQVIFFGEGEGEGRGEVVVNREASKGVKGEGARAKL